MDINLNPYQFDFVYSPERYPALVGGWGTGKTLCSITRSLIYSRYIPDNLGIIFRKTARSLNDSTLKDFEKYTKLKVNSNRDFTFPNNSTIMFRHMDEIDSINQQNINLGWFYIEQGEELDSDKEFMMLFGRLRRDLIPTKEFNSTGLSLRSGWIIANAGDNWIKRLWKDEPMEGSALIEATTMDNAKNLPKDFLDSLQVLKLKRPEMYKQYVENDWTVTTDQYILIKPKELEALQGMTIHVAQDKYLISIDPSMGGDECVFKAFKNTREIDQLILHERDTMKVAGEAMLFGAKHKIDDFVIDSIGIGKGIADRLTEIGKRVIHNNVGAGARNDAKFGNLKSEIWWYAMEQVQDKKVEYPEDQETRKQITSVKYKVLNSGGKILMEPKVDTKKRLTYSPDRADAWVQGIWALQFITPRVLIRKDAYSTRQVEYDFNPNTV